MFEASVGFDAALVALSEAVADVDRDATITWCRVDLKRAMIVERREPAAGGVLRELNKLL